MPGIITSIPAGSSKAYLHCTGTCFVYVAFPSFSGLPITNFQYINPWSGGPIYYVGTTEKNPVAETEVAYNGVFTSESGPRVPFDKEYLGTQETLVFDFNDFNANVLDMLESAPLYGRSISSLQNRAAGASGYGVVGANSSLDYGTLLLANGGYYQLWIQYSFYGTPNAIAYPDMPPGWFYFACNTAMVYVPKMGLRTKVRRLVVEANNLRVPNGSMGMKTNLPAYFAPLASVIPG